VVRAVIVVIGVAPVPRGGLVGSVEWRVGWRKGMGSGGAVDGKVVGGDVAMCWNMRGIVGGWAREHAGWKVDGHKTGRWR
jgi:hypothetical protein